MGYMLVKNKLKKKNNLSSAMYVSVFLTKGKIRQDFLQILTLFFLLLRALIMH